MALFLNLDKKAGSYKTIQEAGASSESPKKIDSPKKIVCEDLYEYGDGVPDVANKKKEDKDTSSDHDGSRVHRKSSLKGSNRRGSRRASIHGCLTMINVEIHVPGKGTQHVRRRRTIDFNLDKSVVEVPRIPAEDQAKVWLQSSDFQRINREISSMKSKMLSGDILPWEEEETRGLEKIVDGSRKKAVWKSKDAVFDEQDVQDSINDYNDHAIAEAYKKCTSDVQRDATVVAKQDAIEARSYLRSPTTQKLLLKSMRRCSC